MAERTPSQTAIGDGYPWALARLRLRIRIGDGHQLGPGKIDLLDAITETNSLADAARLMGMSERRAGLLVEAVNRMFVAPIVVIDGERAAVTALGLDLIAAFRRLEAQTRATILAEFAGLAPQFATDLATHEQSTNPEP